jgi:hypothetical protein
MLQRYAKLVNDVVIKLHILSVDAITNEDGQIDEAVGSSLLAQIHDDVPENFIACELESGPRGLYVRPGYVYHREIDQFRPQQTFPSWIFNETNWEWEAPVPQPQDDQKYYWDEESVEWKVAEEIPGV